MISKGSSLLTGSDFPDPDVIRVNDTYYLASTTMHFSPGCAILRSYDLIIQCGGCMFNRKYVCSRIEKAKEAGVPMTNYGIAIAGLQGILDKVVLP